MSSTHTSAHTSLPGYGTFNIVAMDKTSILSSGTSLSSGLLLSQTKAAGKVAECSLESVLDSSKEMVSAIESMLRGLDVSGVDRPSSRDPPSPHAIPASNQISLASDSSASVIGRGSNRNGGLGLSDIISQIQASKDSESSYRGNAVTETLSAFSVYSSRGTPEKLHERSSIEEKSYIREARRLVNLHMERQYMDTPHRDGSFRDLQSSHVPNFQRPLLRKAVVERMSASRRRSFDDSQLALSDLSSYVDGPASLSDALSEGLSSSSDWSSRVSAFSYIKSLLQQGTRGIQEVIQNFEEVMKLFFQHLDDPHHKVAQAALFTLADIIKSCRKPFESYMERIVPHVFSRLIDPKEFVRQL